MVLDIEEANISTCRMQLPCYLRLEILVLTRQILLQLRFILLLLNHAETFCSLGIFWLQLKWKPHILKQRSHVYHRNFLKGLGLAPPGNLLAKLC